ncbi:MAG TPA: PPC domain-containing DNA-binding protein [Chloroflexia bacterium]|nr:PPC domain-containing DNA-binding protein [Chloroflexia bacterium]
MQYQRFGGRYIVRLESGEAVIETLTGLLQAEGVQFASVSAIGAVRRAQLGYWNAATGEYEFRDFEEQMEVVSFGGNCSLKGGKPFLHIHCVLGRRDFSVIAGHLKEAEVHPTLEVWLRTEQSPVRRARDSESGLDLLDLPEKPHGQGEAR